MLRNRILAAFWVLLILASAAALAGTDVTLFDSEGSVLQPSRVEEASSLETCGLCHDFEEHAQSVHFNRNDPEADLDYTDCLSCHVSNEKKAFTSDGLIKQAVTAPPDSSCTLCHGYEEWSQQRSHTAHAAMSCYDCHQGAGHQKASTASCAECHLNGKSKAPKPIHAGFTNWHIKNIACETCHIRQLPEEESAPGYTEISGVICAVSEGDTSVHHNVAKASDSWGSRGCGQCHSTKSAFFFGTTVTDETNDNGDYIKVANYKSIGLNKNALQISALREGILKPYSGWLFLAVLALSLVHYGVFGPRRVRILPDEPAILRFTRLERFIHLLAVASFLFLAITGIMFLMHWETPGSGLRAVHGEVGAVFALAVIGMLLVWWKNGLFVSCDKDWVCKMGGYLWIKGDCPAEKFNAGQKMFYWFIVVIAGALISITGFLLLLGRGAAAGWVFSLHDFLAVVLIVGILGHVYLSVFANPGTLKGVVTGRVKHSWAKHHHSRWFERHKK